MKFEIEVVYNNLPQLNKRMRQNVRRALRDTALECETIAKQYAPFRYGFLRDSIQAEEESELSWIVAPHTDYAIFMEYGTARVAPRPYMRPAARSVEGRFRQRMQQAVEDAGGRD